MKPMLDLVGKTFGRLTVTEFANFRYLSSGRRKPLWKAICSCGKGGIYLGEKLRSGYTKSCGCLRDETFLKLVTKHGSRHNPELEQTYCTWKAIRGRCNAPKNNSFKYYGARGIKICERWNDFKLFLEDRGKRPADSIIDRIDCNGDYCPQNCRWIFRKDSNHNRRTSRWITFQGKTQNLTQWAAQLGYDREQFKYWLNSGKTIEEIIVNTK